ncbi:hypothetical protein [Tomitella cavernea]|uniref:Helix-turn-helix DNA binding domain protein n=1 Tax=Tomitella cavernea TaxID=1387982 RepID=A0ABP9CFB7_9ACTN|nr:hypothetical protein [Tomitella cavernea]
MTSHQTDTDGFFLDRSGQKELRDLLEQVPGVVEDLAVTIARQDCFGRSPGRRGRLSASPMPFNPEASEAGDELRAVLAGWVRRTCEARQLDYGGANDVLSMARWLRRWIIAVALTDGAEEIVDDVGRVLRYCRRLSDRPRDPRTFVDPATAREAEARARAKELTPAGVLELGRSLGAPWDELTKARIRTLRIAGKLPVLREIRIGAGDPIRVYRMGDVMDAHLDHPTRQAAPGA